MGTAIGAVMTFAAALAGEGIQAPPAPVSPAIQARSIFDTSDVPVIPTGPVGRWALYGKGVDSCAVTRNYGTAQKPVTLSIKSSIDQKLLILSIVTPAAASPQRWGKGAVVMKPGTSTNFNYGSFDVVERGQHFDVFDTKRSTLDGLAAGGTLSIRASATTTIATGDAVDAIRMMDRCQAKLFTSWGIDPARFGYGKPAPMPVVAPERWFTTGDYPAAAVKAHQQGRVLVALEIGSDGLVKACHVAAGAGAALDEASCSILLARARFKPASDAAGAPVTSWALVPVRWNLGG